MLREFLVPVATLSFWMVLCVLSVNQLCQFHLIYQATAARLQSERWLRAQCEDPHFFSNMHLHSDLCFTVENNARVGAFMLSLREFTQGVLAGGGAGLAWIPHRLLSWPVLLGAALVLLFLPSLLVGGCRSLVMHNQRRWPHCRELHFKDA
jgi:hypothetical protein